MTIDEADAALDWLDSYKQAHEEAEQQLKR